MSSKAVNQALINAIQDAGSNTAAEARAAWDGLLNEQYATNNYKNEADTDILTRSGGLSSSLLFRVNIKKAGNTVHLSGYLQNNQSLTLGGAIGTTPVILYTDNAYKPKTGLQFYTDQMQGDQPKLRFNSSGIFINYALAPNEIIYFNITYTTND